LQHTTIDSYEIIHMQDISTKQDNGMRC